MGVTDYDAREGAVAGRILPDGREAVVYPLLFTHRLVVGLPGAPTLDDVWCYANRSLAIAALVAWDGEGEPEGWHRHPPTGRRRTDGDPEREYVL